jgi:hypothetical protein
MNFFANNMRFYIVRWLAGCLIFLSWSCSRSAAADQHHNDFSDSVAEARKMDRAYVQIAAVKNTIAPGDLIVRTGNDFTSESLRSLNQRNQDYSHCGIASIENDTVFVYHSLGGEWNPDQKIRRDPLELFAEPYSNRGIGVFRFDISKAEIASLMVTVKKLHEMGIMFDMKFDLNSNDHMYCAEFVYKCYLMGTHGKLQFNTSHIGSFAFIGVDDLFLHPLCKELSRIVYR